MKLPQVERAVPRRASKTHHCHACNSGKHERCTGVCLIPHGGRAKCECACRQTCVESFRTAEVSRG